MGRERRGQNPLTKEFLENAGIGIVRSIMKHPLSQSADAKPREPKTEASPEKKFLLTKILPTDRLSVHDQLSIVRAFVSASGEKNSMPVRNSEVARFAEMQPADILLTNPFFCDLNLLTKVEHGFLVSQEAVAYQSAYATEKDASIQHLKPVFAKTWFSQLLTGALVRGPISQYQALTMLADASTAVKEYESRLEMLLQFLEATGIVVRRAGKIWLNDGSREIPPLEQPRRMPALVENTPSPELDELEKYELILDTKKKRRVVLFAPASVTAAELARIQQWVAVQLLVIEKE